MTIYGLNYGYFKREKNGCTATRARTKLHKIKIVIFFTRCMWCYDAFLVTKYVIVMFSRRGFYQKSQNSIQKINTKYLPFLSLIFLLMPNLDIIYDVTIAVTWDEIKTNYQVISHPTSLPSSVTFDAFYFCLQPKTLSFERYGRKSPSNRPPS